MIIFRLTRLQPEAARLVMTNFATMMASRDKPLRMLSPMRSDLFRHGRLYTRITFLGIILLSPRSLRANLKTV